MDSELSKAKLTGRNKNGGTKSCQGNGYPKLHCKNMLELQILHVIGPKRKGWHYLVPVARLRG